MKPGSWFFKTSILIFIFIVSSCTKDNYTPQANGLLKKIRQGDYIVEEISYNKNNLVSEVNSTSFYRKFHYSNDNRLLMEEVAVSPDIFSSSIVPGSTHEFVDPVKTGISLVQIYEYDESGRLIIQSNYVPENRDNVLRSKRTFEYDNNNLISRILMHNTEDEVTQFHTYIYDPNGNVSEEEYYTFLFIPEGSGPKLLYKTTFEYDHFNNPFRIFEHSAIPGIYTNRNNIIRSNTINFDPAPGVPAESESVRNYEYNYETGYPVRVSGGEEYIYE